MARFKIISDSGVKIVALWKEKNSWSNLTNSYYRSRAVRIAVCCSTCASTISAAGSRGVDWECFISITRCSIARQSTM